MTKVNTRARILETALALFNEHGTRAVSTNHMAASLGISPGNLYYHFRNKEEIIRAIVEQKDARWEALYHLPSDRTPTLSDIERLVRENFALVWDYRFFFRELSALTQRDPQLKASYQQLRRERLAAFEALFAQFVRAGVLRPAASPARVGDLAKLCWLISDYWLPFIELEGELAVSDVMDQGVAIYLQALDPSVNQTGTALDHQAHGDALSFTESATGAQRQGATT